jgi:hypothetical protein
LTAKASLPQQNRVGSGGLLNPDNLGIYILACCFVFPVANYFVRKRKNLAITRGRVIEKVIMGASAPTFLFLALSPVQPELLTKISDQPYYLVTAGAIGLIMCLFAVVDDES